MASTQNLKRRLKGVKNIGQITKAMELVAATKMRRSQEIAIKSRAYAYTALDMLSTLSRLEDIRAHPLLEKREVKKTLVVVVTSDKGLAGSFNSAVIREFEKFLKDAGSLEQYSFAAVGQKALKYVEKRTGNVTGSFVRFGDYTTPEEVRPLSEFFLNGYTAREFDKVIVIATNFESALKQKVIRREVFPISTEQIRKTAEEIIPKTGKFANVVIAEEKRELDYLIEPTPAEVLDALIPYLVEMEIYHIILEANASEHAARRMAMKNASDNAKELATKFTITYNKLRQSAITTEIAEITSGAEALRA